MPEISLPEIQGRSAHWDSGVPCVVFHHTTGGTACVTVTKRDNLIWHKCISRPSLRGTDQAKTWWGCGLPRMTTLISRESALCLNECDGAAAYLERAQRDGVGAAQEVNGGQSVLGFKAGDKYTGAPRCARPRPAHYVLPGAELVCARTNDLEGWRDGERDIM